MNGCPECARRERQRLLQTEQHQRDDWRAMFDRVYGPRVDAAAMRAVGGDVTKVPALLMEWVIEAGRRKVDLIEVAEGWSHAAT